MSFLCRRLCRCRLPLAPTSNRLPFRLMRQERFTRVVTHSNSDKKVAVDAGDVISTEGVRCPERTGPEDFLGLNGGEGVVEVEGETLTSDVVTKYEYLFKKQPRRTEEKVFVANFGSIRYDADNQPFYFGEGDLPSDEMDTNPARGGGDFIEKQYFDVEQPAESESVIEGPALRPGYVDEQSFCSESVNAPEAVASQLRSLPTRAPFGGIDLSTKNRGCQTAPNYIDEVYFPEQPGGSDDVRNVGQVRGGNDVPLDDLSRNGNATFPKPQAKVEKKSRERLEVNIENPQTAFDYVMKLRSEKGANLGKPGALKEGHVGDGQEPPFAGKVDSKGFRIYKDQVTDLENEPEMTVLHILKNSVLYNENDIVALSKPYGLPSHHGAGHRHSLTKFLPDLAKYLSKVDSSELFTVHRLDKETTGVILLAKTQAMAQILHSLLAQGKIVKTYWALTKCVPTPAAGIIDIPMAESTVNEKSRMVLKPDYCEETKSVVRKSSVKLLPAVTKYQVLASSGNAALVELQPTTGVKHQLRVHLASALGCPVLGDHKYSHLTKLAPQKLPPDMLERLDVRQSKVRHIPMHLHARSVVIPEVVDGKNIHIGARLPRHFVQNMRRLKIKSIKT